LHNIKQAPVSIKKNYRIYGLTKDDEKEKENENELNDRRVGEMDMKRQRRRRKGLVEVWAGCNKFWRFPSDRISWRTTALQE
jgi:hypothetical protein